MPPTMVTTYVHCVVSLCQCSEDCTSCHAEGLLDACAERPCGATSLCQKHETPGTAHNPVMQKVPRYCLSPPALREVHAAVLSSVRGAI